MKWCPKCQKHKPQSDFNRDASKPDGYKSHCKACRSLYFQENTEAYYKRAKDWRVRHPEYKWKNKHGTQSRKNWLSKNVERMRLLRRKWQELNREKSNRSKQINLAKRRAKMKESGNLTVSDWESLCREYENKCVCCGKLEPLTVDHVVALSRGGTNTIDNIQPLCKTCNSRKNYRTIDYRKQKAQ